MLKNFYNDALPLFMAIMKEALPQTERYYAEVYKSVHQTFLNNSFSRFGINTMRDAHLFDDRDPWYIISQFIVIRRHSSGLIN